MDIIENLRIYPFVKSEIDSQRAILNTTDLSRLVITRYLELTVIRVDLGQLGLEPKPPMFIQGAIKSAEYYSDYIPELDLFPSNTLVAKINFTDMLLPRYWKLGIKAFDLTLNTLSIVKDRANVINVGDVHAILDGVDGVTIKGRPTVSSVTFLGGVTTVGYNNLPANTSIGDVCYFPKGERLAGIKANYTWYNKDGTDGLLKTEEKILSIAEAGDLERLRRERSITHMIASAENTDIQEEVVAIKSHYDSYIDVYERIGDWQSWTNAIDNESNPTILAYLAIQIPARQADGSLLIRTVKEFMKNGMYKGYN